MRADEFNISNSELLRRIEELERSQGMRSGEGCGGCNDCCNDCCFYTCGMYVSVEAVIVVPHFSRDPAFFREDNPALSSDENFAEISVRLGPGSQPLVSSGQRQSLRPGLACPLLEL